MLSLIDVVSDDLNHLSPTEAVDLVRNLLRSEADASGIKSSAIDVPSNINARDGGIDGVVRDAEHDGKHGIIKKGTTTYQIKSGSFRANASDVKDILFDKSGKLKSKICDCFKAGGTFVVVFTGWNTPTPKQDLQSMFVEQAAKAGYKKARIEVWCQNTIIGFLEHFPPLALSVKRVYSLPLHTHQEWSGMADMLVQMHLGKAQRAFVNSMRTELRDNRHAHVRVSGDPGIGKTRLVLEATSVDDLSPYVIYFDEPSDLLKHVLLTHIYRPDSQIRAILVVDECSFADQARIWNYLKGMPNIALITIFTEEDHSADTRMVAPPLENTEIASIIQGYIGNDPHIPQWVEWCKPSPRVGHVVGDDLKNNPQNLLKSPDYVDVWGRYIAGRETDPAEIERRRKILPWLSLFKRFGFESPHSDEAKRIAKLVGHNEGVPFGEFMSTIRGLRQRKILQGSTTLYITPKLLHLHLWMEWWNTYGLDDFPRIEDLIPPGQASEGDNLLNWSRAMFEYGKQHPKTAGVARKLLASATLADAGEPFRSLDADFFRVLSKAAPADALTYLERTVCQKSKDYLQKFRIERRPVVSALERMVTRGEHLESAARVLVKLAEAENEGWSNNATGVFQNMFKSSHMTAQPDRMIRILKDSAASDSIGAKEVVVGACNAALEDGGSLIVHDMDDLEPLPPPYAPSWSEWIQYRLQILDVLQDQRDTVPDKVAGVVLHNAHSLIRVPELEGSIVDALSRVRATKKNDTELVERVSSILNVEKLGDETTDRLKAILSGIAGTSFSSKLRRYVGMPEHVDMISEATRASRKKAIYELAESAASLDALKPELDWLVTDKAAQGYEFGYRLAEKDPSWALLSEIMQAVKTAGSDGDGRFVGGYLMRVREQEPDRWRTELDAIYEDGNTCALLPGLARLSGITDESVKKIMRGIKDGRLGSDAMNHVLNSDNISESTFVECADLLAESEYDDAAFIALDLVYFRFVRHKKRLPKEITARVLLHDNVVNRTTESASTGRGEWVWKEVGSEFVKQYPDEGINVMESVISRMDEAALLYREAGKGSVMEEIVKANPSKAWDVLSKYVGPPTDRRAYALQKWLAGPAFDRDKSAMRFIPMSKVISWAGEDDGPRATHLAAFLPDNFEYVREFLSRYGDRPDVQDALARNFGNAGWSGSSSRYYQEKKKEIADQMALETDYKILSWLRFYDQFLDRSMKRFADLEERHKD